MADEKIVQVNTVVHSENLKFITALTNQGRIFTKQNLYAEWEEIDPPELNKAKPRAQAKESGYSYEFELLWSECAVGNKKTAYRQYKARLSECDNVLEHADLIYSALQKYVKYVDSTGQWKMHLATFLGRDKHYLNDYTIPDNVKKQNRVKQEWETIPEKNLTAFIEKHGFKKGDRMETEFETRNRLKAEIRARVEAEYN